MNKKAKTRHGRLRRSPTAKVFISQRPGGKRTKTQTENAG
jgi:hypothetical protein